MTDAELDATDMKIFQEESRLRRIAMGSGRPAREVGSLMQEFKKMSMMWGKMKGVGAAVKGTENKGEGGDIYHEHEPPSGYRSE